jgi:hypothetical protein
MGINLLIICFEWGKNPHYLLNHHFIAHTLKQIQKYFEKSKIIEEQTICFCPEISGKQREY